ncbi:uncharacterized protein J7T54_005691 [Emericellopsis cladophorae]|uniref:FAD/NAD(P)-binding domain-containing protein n=1 Tax=Emericellopsis cladophorae TaxID=2686198 RepID=A0A9Q0BF71_9HYPO|nr:uncharacterized protein J7T54_005691 [Emericellopsis cladophorae]KAI6783662.1 hypothetical protein J7T54_005691 [Emericellopsis cladophorae]
MSPIQAHPPVRVFIAGGSYAGLSSALNLLDIAEGLTPRVAREPHVHHPDLPKFDIEITVVDERDGFYHLIGTPLALCDAEYSKKAWVKFSDVPSLDHPSIKVLQGSVTHVDCETKKATVVDHASKEAAMYEYDYFIAASGLRRVWPVAPRALTRKQYLIEASELIHTVDNAKDGVVVVGGGAVGIEVAAELKLVKPHVNVTLVHSRDKLLSSEGLSEECKDKALELLLESGVEVLMGHRLKESKPVDNGDGAPRFEILFTNGKTMVASEVIMAISKSVPTTTYLPTSALDEEGLVKIRPNLKLPQETPNSEYHFCAGDAVLWSGIKRCGGAMYMGWISANNIHQSILRDFVGHKPKFFEMQPTPPMIGLAVGKQAVSYGPEVGTAWGEDVMQAYFNNDLGFDICWNYMQLSGRKDEVKV